MTTHVDQPSTVAALGEVWTSAATLLGDLDPAEWRRPTALPGWDVQAVVAHVIGTEAMLLGEATPEVTVDREAATHVHNDIGAFNEAWVLAFADLDHDDMLATFVDMTDQRRRSLAELDAEAWAAESFTPAGPDTYGRFMRIRVFDCWFHEQDIRDAVARPGHDAGPAVALTLDEMQGSMGYVVGKRAAAPDGASLTFALTGPEGRDIHVAVDGRAAVVPVLPGPATTTLSMPVGTFARLGGGRVRPETVADQVEIHGDADLGRRVLAAMAYTI